MYGLVNLAIQELVCSQYGADKWQQVCEIAGASGVYFQRMQSYPDALTYKLIEGVSLVLGITADEALFALGEYFVLHTGREGYGHLFALAGRSLLEFLHNLDVLHSRVGQNFAGLSPPSFQCEDLGPRSVRLRYYTDRRGLCPMVRGLLGGLAGHFATPASIQHEPASCTRSGSDHCEFTITVLGAPAVDTSMQR